MQPLTLAASAPGGTFLSRSYGFGLGTADNGNVQYILNNLDQSRSQAFTYDELNRVKTAGSEASWGEAFGYDPWGNLLGIQVTQGTAESLTVSVTPTDGSPSKNQIAGFCYDAAGNLLDQGACPAQGVHTYVYDRESRLAATAGVTYGYDGDGKRVAKSSGKLYWTGTGSDPLDESDAAGAMNEEYVFFNGKRIARVDLPAGTVHFYFADHLGSASVVTSAGGVVEQESDYYPFGGERVITAGPNNYKFTGKERDGESGLDEFGARYYSSALGRFTTADWSEAPVPVPYADLTDPQTLHLYAYERNSPTTRADVDGHCGPLCGAILGAGVGATVILYKTGKAYYTGKGTIPDNAEIAKTLSGGAIIGAIAGTDATDEGDKHGQDQGTQEDRSEKESPHEQQANGDQGSGSTPQSGSDKSSGEKGSRKSTPTIRNEWEAANGKPWPRDEDTGRNQDAHHSHARGDGGTDDPSNIQPMPHQEHMDHHKENGDFQRWGRRAHDKQDGK